MIHPLSEVQSSSIGTGTTIWQFSIVLKNAVIGDNCNINCHCFVENEVKIGDNVTLKSGVYVWDGITIENDVFVGPNVTFVNNPYPRSKKFLRVHPKTLIKRGASIGAASIILSGIEIGEFALIGAGSVVTKNIPNNALVVGNPARIVGWVNDEGEKLHQVENYYVDSKGERYFVIGQKLIKQ
jgi:acetyltransferase-like isoleucine patch superfamily enzyme